MRAADSSQPIAMLSGDAPAGPRSRIRTSISSFTPAARPGTIASGQPAFSTRSPDDPAASARAPAAHRSAIAAAPARDPRIGNSARAGAYSRPGVAAHFRAATSVRVVAVILRRQAPRGGVVADLGRRFGLPHQRILRERAARPVAVHAAEHGHRFPGSPEPAQRPSQRERRHGRPFVARVLAQDALQIRDRLRGMVGQPRHVRGDEQLVHRVARERGIAGQHGVRAAIVAPVDARAVDLRRWLTTRRGRVRAVGRRGGTGRAREGTRGGRGRVEATVTGRHDGLVARVAAPRHLDLAARNLHPGCFPARLDQELCSHHPDGHRSRMDFERPAGTGHDRIPRRAANRLDAHARRALLDDAHRRRRRVEADLGSLVEADRGARRARRRGSVARGRGGRPGVPAHGDGRDACQRGQRGGRERGLPDAPPPAEVGLHVRQKPFGPGFIPIQLQTPEFDSPVVHRTSPVLTSILALGAAQAALRRRQRAAEQIGHRFQRLALDEPQHPRQPLVARHLIERAVDTRDLRPLLRAGAAVDEIGLRADVQLAKPAPDPSACAASAACVARRCVSATAARRPDREAATATRAPG